VALFRLNEKSYTFIDEENPDKVSNAIIQEIKNIYNSSNSDVSSLSDNSNEKDITIIKFFINEYLILVKYV